MRTAEAELSHNSPMHRAASLGTLLLALLLVVACDPAAGMLGDDGEDGNGDGGGGGNGGSGCTDADGDGYCVDVDCEDTVASVHPGALEVCDGYDSNCDGNIGDDEADTDGDGWPICSDCDETRKDVHPDAEEVCDGIDTDCDGELMKLEDVDEDGDHYYACTDCNDQDSEIRPGAEEVCDGVDNNCDGALFWDDEAGNGENSDDDGDGWAPCMGDCDDDDPMSYPYFYELLTDGADNDCDGQGDNFPGFGPLTDTAEVLQQTAEIHCNSHYGTLVTEAFEDNGVGEVLASELASGLSLSADSDSADLYFVYSDSAGLLTPFEGTQFAAPHGSMDGIWIDFPWPQDMVALALAGAVPAQSVDYQVYLYWGEKELIGGPFFGAEFPAEEGWNFRGILSTTNVGFDRMLLVSPNPGENLFLDSIYFCDTSEVSGPLEKDRDQ